MGGRLMCDDVYAELHAKTNFSFLEGASHPSEMVARAAELGYRALAVTDRNSLAGIVRAHGAAKDAGLKLIVGAEITPEDAPPVALWAPDRAAYGRLARLITQGRRRAEKGQCRLSLADIAEHAEGLLAGVRLQIEERGERGEQRGGEGQRGRGGDLRASIGGRVSPSPPLPLSPSGCFPLSALLSYRELFGDRCYLLAELHYGPDDRRQLDRLREASRQTGIPLVAAGDAHYHVAGRAALHDVLTAIRHGCPVAEATGHLFPNAQRHLQSPAEMARLFADAPDALRRTVEIADRCTFSLDELRYEYPEELAPPGMTPGEHLARLTWRGAGRRWPGGVPEKVRGAAGARTAIDRPTALRGLFSHGLGPGAVRPAARHPLPGTRLGGQLGRLLLPGHHLGRSRADGRALRAVRQPRAERGARHRRRFRAPAARGGAPVPLSQVRPRAGGNDGGGDHLPPPLRDPGRGQGPGNAARRNRPAGETGRARAR